MEPISLASEHGRRLSLNGIETLIYALLNDISNDRSLTLPIPRRTNQRRHHQRLQRQEQTFADLASDDHIDVSVQSTLAAASLSETTRTSQAAFPGKESQPNAAVRFTILLTVLAHMHSCIAHGVRMTKRDLFYQEPALFRTQQMVDRCVEDVTVALGVRREELGVIAAAKGLAAGELELWIDKVEQGTKTPDVAQDQQVGTMTPSVTNSTSTQSHVQEDPWQLLFRCGIGCESSLIPHIDSSVPESSLRWNLRSIHWVLVVEKEAIFRHLMERDFLDSCARPGLLVTAKGYPDVDTRAFLHRIAVAEPCLPIHVVADWDPDGLSIVATYARGSAAMARRAAELRLIWAEWSGLRAHDVVPLLMNEDVGAGKGVALRLSARDRRLARGLLAADKRSSVCWAARAPWREDVRIMLMLNVKAEIQLLECAPDGICELLKRRMRL